MEKLICSAVKAYLSTKAFKPLPDVKKKCSTILLTTKRCVLLYNKKMDFYANAACMRKTDKEEKLHTKPKYLLPRKHDSHTPIMLWQKSSVFLNFLPLS